MIVPMLRVFLATRQENQAAFLKDLASAGVVQIESLNASTALANHSDLEHLEILKRTVQVSKPAAPSVVLDPQAIATELAGIHSRAREAHEKRHHLNAHLHALGPWGKTSLQALESLEKNGVSLRLVQGPAKDLAAECIIPFGEDWYALIDGPDATPAPLPLGVTELPRPSHDHASLLQALAQLDAAQAADEARLRELAPLAAGAALALENTCALQVAERSALCQDGLFVVRGWIAAKKLGHLEAKLSGQENGQEVCIYSREPLDDEEPPTLIEHPAWTKPIDGLFKILGAAAGYREFDVSAVFMLALPIFAAMLISDWGYSAILVLMTIIAARQIRTGMGDQFLHLVRTIGVVGILWGLLTDSCFGFGILVRFGVWDHAVIAVNASKSSTDFVMFLSFTIGTVHLLTAWLWQVWRQFPSLGMLSPLGWGFIVVGMYGLIQHLLLANAAVRIDLPFPTLLIIGAVLAVGFRDVRRPVRGILIGIADFPLSAIGKFGDVMSYVRLMAVGLAGSLLASSFNDMAAQAGEHLGIIAQVLILIFAHSLNLALCCIAIFAHGVRLNMLEFSTNLGLTWSGRSFHPFTNHRID